MTKGISCSDFSHCPSVASVKRSYQIDQPSIPSIKKEILRNGMVVTDWFSPSYMKAYKGGIFAQ